MASLHPGVIFSNAGLNKRSTSLLTHEKGGNHSSRNSHENQVSPRLSPVARVYDVRNSSSRLILLNNKLSNSSNGSRLKGQTDYKGDIKHPEPKRHFSASPYSERHKKCWYTMPVREESFPALTQSASPSAKDGNKASYSSKRTISNKQTSSKIYSAGNSNSDEYRHADYKLIKLFERLAQPLVLPIRRKRYQLSPSMSSALGKSTLKHGERHYLSSIAEIYGVEHLGQHKFMQYNQLMWGQLFKGHCNLKNVDKYFKYMTRHQYARERSSASQKRSLTSPSRRRSRSGEKTHKGRTESKSPSQTGSPGKNNQKQREVRGKKTEARRTENNSEDESKKEQSSKTLYEPNNSLDMIKDEKDTKSGTKLNDNPSQGQQQSKSYTNDWVESSHLRADSEKKDVLNMKRNMTDSFFDEDTGTESISLESYQKERGVKVQEHESERERDLSSSDSEQEDKIKAVKKETCTSDEVSSNASKSEKKEQSKEAKEKRAGTDMEKQLTSFNLETDSKTVAKSKDDIPKETKYEREKTNSSSSDSEQGAKHEVDPENKIEGDKEKEYERSKVENLESYAERESETNAQENKVTADVKFSEISQGEMALGNAAVVDNYEYHSSAEKENDNGENNL